MLFFICELIDDGSIHSSPRCFLAMFGRTCSRFHVLEIFKTSAGEAAGKLLNFCKIHLFCRTWPRTSAVAERLWTGLDYANPDPVTIIAARRLEEHTCRMNRRRIPAQPPNGPGFCVGAPPAPQQMKYYEVLRV